MAADHRARSDRVVNLSGRGDKDCATDHEHGRAQRVNRSKSVQSPRFATARKA